MLRGALKHTSVHLGHITWPSFRPRQKNMPFIPRIRIFDPVTNTYANLEMKDYLKYLGLMID